MKITDKRGRPRQSRKLFLRDIEIDAVFSCTIGGVRYSPCLRTYDEVVCLESPRHTWSAIPSSPTCALDYSPLDAELVIHGEAK